MFTSSTIRRFPTSDRTSSPTRRTLRSQWRVAEFELADPVVAIQGSGTADAPYLLFHLDTTGTVGHHRLVQPARHRRDRRQRRPAGRPPVPRRLQWQLHECSGRLRRRRNDGPCLADGNPGERRLARGRQHSRWSRSGSSRRTRPATMSGSASTTSRSLARRSRIRRQRRRQRPRQRQSPRRRQSHRRLRRPLPRRRRRRPRLRPGSRSARSTAAAETRMRTFQNDFIELFNPTASDVSLVGWSVQYGPRPVPPGR